jgi:hypothetical protein
LGFSGNDFLIDFILFDFKVISESFATKLQRIGLRWDGFLRFGVATAHDLMVIGLDYK